MSEMNAIVLASPSDMEVPSDTLCTTITQNALALPSETSEILALPSLSPAVVVMPADTYETALALPSPTAVVMPADTYETALALPSPTAVVMPADTYETALALSSPTAVVMPADTFETALAMPADTSETALALPSPTAVVMPANTSETALALPSPAAVVMPADTSETALALTADIETGLALPSETLWMTQWLQGKGWTQMNELAIFKYYHVNSTRMAEYLLLKLDDSLLSMAMGKGGKKGSNKVPLFQRNIPLRGDTGFLRLTKRRHRAFDVQGQFQLHTDLRLDLENWACCPGAKVRNLCFSCNLADGVSWMLLFRSLLDLRF